MHKAWLVIGLASLFGCGYTESEWQAQLAKYDHLDGQYQAEKRAHEQTRAELEATRLRVSSLEDDLRKLGYNLDTVSAQLQQTGTEKDQLASSLDQMKRALNEYRQRAEQLERIKKRFETLRDKLNKLTQIGIKVEVRNNRMVIRLPGDVLFASGQDQLKKEGISVLGEVAAVIRGDAQLSKRYFQIAGHTDNVPLQGGPFRDNWGLSLMRARGVLLWLIGAPTAKTGGGGLDPSRLHAAGFGEIDPVVPNTTPAERTQNRRVELVLLPDVEEMLDLRQLL